jgi:hypothetical protein
MSISKLAIPVAPLAAILLTACSSKDAAVSAPEPAPEANFLVEAQFLPSSNTTSPTIQDRLEGAVHPDLTAQLRLFIDTYKRLPENFYEFSGLMMDSVPPVPPGMKFIIDPSDNTVKVAKK